MEIGDNVSLWYELHKIRSNLTFPLLKDFIIESIDKKVYKWLIKCINITYIAEPIGTVFIDDRSKRYLITDYTTNSTKNVTREEAVSLINEYQSKYNKILPKLYKYNIPIYEYRKEDYNDTITTVKSPLSITKNNGDYSTSYTRF